MSLDKAIAAGKEHRKRYRRSRAWDSHCRNHGLCSWCLGNRMHSQRLREVAARERMKEFMGA